MKAKIVFVSSDIMLWARVRDAARAAGVEVVRVDAEAGLAGALEGPVRRVLVDLETPGIDLRALAVRCRGLSPAPELVGYGSHVLEEALARAERSGFDRVLPRGAFHRSVSALLEA